TIKDSQILAEAHGLLLTDEMSFNAMGMGFKVGFDKEHDVQQWWLRSPRRNELGNQIEKEKRILNLAKKHVAVQVPDWKVATSTMVAYPLLKDKPALSFHEKTYEVTWNMDEHSPNYVPSLAKALVELHGIPVDDVLENGLKVMKPADLRPEIAARLQLVKS